MVKRTPDFDDERELLRRIASGDEAAFEQVFAALQRPVYSLALRVTREPAIAEELASEAFVRLWRKAGDYDPSRGRVASWLFSVVHHLAIDHLRARNLREAGRVRADDQGYDPLQQAAAPLIGTSPWQRERLLCALQDLTEVQRQAVTLAYFEGLSRVQMAQRLGLPLTTVKTRLRDGLLVLKRRFADPEVSFLAWTKGRA